MSISLFRNILATPYALFDLYSPVGYLVIFIRSEFSEFVIFRKCQDNLNNPEVVQHSKSRYVVFKWVITQEVFRLVWRKVFRWLAASACSIVLTWDMALRHTPSVLILTKSSKLANFWFHMGANFPNYMSTGFFGVFGA